MYSYANSLDTSHDANSNVLVGVSMLFLRVDESDMTKEEIVTSKHSVQIEETHSSHH